MEKRKVLMVFMLINASRIGTDLRKYLDVRSKRLGARTGAIKIEHAPRW